jgi:tRNA-intron endonuclease
MPEKQKAKPVKGELIGERVLTEATDAAREFYDRNRYGSVLENGKVQLSLMEALLLVEKNKLEIKSGRKRIKFDALLKTVQNLEPSFWVKYCVYKDLRARGYIVKTALKFGADFRVYDRGVKPGEDHARWVVFPVHENNVLTWHEFAAKNRVAHSTKKRLLIGIVDEENSVTYYEIRWVRP